MLGHNAPGRSMGARIGDLIEPLAELRVEIIEVAKAPTKEEVLADVAERALDFALGLHCQLHPVLGYRRPRR